MANLWKIGREVKRLKQQFRGLFEVFHEPRTQARYDRNRLAHLTVTQGAVPVSDRIAILMIYQPKVLPPSVLVTCRHLAQHGYAPFVISNGALAPADRARLGAEAWRVADRPNYGYDFGAYRDGILALKDWAVSPRSLIILNDSIWYPLYPDDDLIERLEQSDADIAGTILRVRPKPRLSPGPAEVRFLESYCYRIAGHVFAGPAFDAYWRGYRMTDNKYKVIRRGERDFSRAMLTAGLRVGAVFSETALREVLAEASAEDLRKTLIYGAHADENVAHEQMAVLADFADSAEWRALALAHIDRALARGVFNSAFCYPTIGLMHANYLKKSGERINQLWRGAFVAAVTAGDLPAPQPLIRAEVLAAVDRAD